MFPGTPLMMENGFGPPTEAVGNIPEPELAELLSGYPGLEKLEPFYVAWEMIWPM
jgi:hypothetical protein